MAIRINDLNGMYFVEVGAYTVGNASDIIFNRIDPFSFLFDGQLFGVGLYPCHYLIGAYNDRVNNAIEVMPTKPQTSGYSGDIDWRKYGSVFSSLATVGRLARGEDLWVPDPRNEHNTWHPSYVGVTGKARAANWYEYSLHHTDYMAIPYQTTAPFAYPNSYGRPWPLGPDDPPLVREVTAALGPNGADFSVRRRSREPSGGWGPRRDVYGAYLRFVESSFPGGQLFYLGQYPWGQRFGVQVLQPHIIDYIPERRFKIGYELVYYDTYFDPDPGMTSVDCTVEFRYDPVDIIPNRHIPTGEWLEISNPGNYYTRYDYTLTATHSSSNPWFHSTAVGTKYTYQHDNVMYLVMSDAVQALDGKSHVMPDLTRLSKDRPLDAFSQRVERFMPDIRLSAYQSTSDALEQGTSAMDTNMYEALGELRTAAGLIPDLSSALQALRAVESTVPLMSVRHVLTLISGLYLANVFGWQPTYELLTKGIYQLEAAVRRIDSLTRKGEIVGRGKFVYQFPTWEFGREKSQLTTRTKIVVGLSGRESLSRILGLQTLKLVPTPSNYWDTIPMSFVIDAFAGIGARLRDIENNLAIIGAMNIRHFVHTFAISSDFTSEELQRYHLSEDGFSTSDDPLGLRVYGRDVSMHPPPLRDGRYDFRWSESIPSWAAPLFWQVFLGR